MWKSSRIAVSLSLSATLVAPAALADQAGGQVQHRPLTCAPAGGNARIQARVAAPLTVASGRVYFRAKGLSPDTYLALRRGDTGEFWAVLPIPEAKTQSFQYRLSFNDADGQTIGTDTYVVPVTASCQAVLSNEEKKYAANLVVGLTQPNQPSRPDGFLCDGIVSQITSAGDLKENDACKSGTWLAAAGGVAAAVAGGVLVTTDKGGRTNPQASPSDRPQQ